MPVQCDIPKSVRPYFEHLTNALAPAEIRTLLDEFRADWAPETTASEGTALAGSELPWRVWLANNFPGVCSAPFSARHERLWEWFEALEPGERPRSRVEVWPRMGAKSSTAELGCARVGVRLARRFALYVSGSQDQADKHVQSVASLFERLGVERAVNVYGHSKGWRRNQLRTANGYNVAAIGLDTASRGVKLDQYRPDLVILDDVDELHDSTRTVEKKIDAITNAIIPAGSPDCALLFVQNLIHEESIFAQLVDGRADFLHDREPACVEPAIRGLVTELVPGPDGPDGANVYRIVSGTPTWAGQGLTTCEQQINAWGLRAFLREAQHEVRGAAGWFFDVNALKRIEKEALPAGLTLCRAWDLAATQDGGDWTVGALVGVVGRAPDTLAFLIDVRRGQWSSDRVEDEIERTAILDGEGVILRLPQDPGQAGVAQARRFKEKFGRFHPRIRPITGDKATRATGLADVINRGNCSMVRGEWNHAVSEVFRRFREDETDQADDEVDACADAYNEAGRPRREYAAA